MSTNYFPVFSLTHINILWINLLAEHTVQVWFWHICLCRFAPQAVLVSQITLMHCNFQNLSQIISWTEIRVLTGQLQNIHLFVLKQLPCKFEATFGIIFLVKFALIPSIKQNAWYVFFFFRFEEYATFYLHMSLNYDWKATWPQNSLDAFSPQIHNQNNYSWRWGCQEMW